ncbi:cell growth-regulating nucleolar protein [Elysia marginata]|uniref:Cell growth-regulating nucleolar protein n=1 Tax=Elysia marginata TaxID=1093978 RepID=A0AAV4FEH4_9GAST|nr:cell growth-regulating nucleolar protein [Elysia marginata]
MVFFNCNACGEALKKNQVEKHTFRCRHCEVLSCVDCGKDFWGNDYQYHTKCMTEEEKYCGQGYVPKINKGEAKQEQWIERVQAAIEKSASNHGLKSLLVRLKDYPNIPRKQQKFQNFLKNSLRVNNESLITQVWNVLMAHNDQEKNKENTSNTVPKQAISINGSGNAASKEEVNGIQNPTTNGNKDDKTEQIAEPKKNKRERKQERQNKANKQEKKDRTENIDEEKPLKKSKKRKHREDDLEELTSEETIPAKNGCSENEPPKKKKKKHSTKDHSQEDASEEVNLEAIGNDQTNFEETKKKKEKFNWEKIITKVLEDKGEISLKKLRKKVLNEFSASGSANYSEENLMAKFDKKLRKMSTVQVHKERAKLKATNI